MGDSIESAADCRRSSKTSLTWEFFLHHEV